MSHAERQLITAADGYAIVSHWYEPSVAAAGAVLIAPAMGVAQNFYAPLARWLAQQGYRAVTFDYRGIGHSAPRHLAGFDTTIRDWAERDCAAVLDAVTESTARTPVFWLGHSLGGQILGMVPNRHHIQKAITVASGSGYWRQVAPRQRLPSLLLWYFAVPLAHKVFGYFPGRKIGVVGDLPKNVMRQWRRWCLNPQYLFGVEGKQVEQDYAKILFPITAFSFTDDEMMTAEGIAIIHQYFVNAPKTIQLLDAHALGIDRIGHFGFFREKFREPLWESRLGPELTV